jgi:hypothetical protein
VEIVGVIRGVPTQYSEKELLESLSTKDNLIKINHVRRFTRTDPEGNKTPLETVAIHFQSDYLPKRVKLYGGVIFPVHKYKKTPLICNRCLNYGHPARLCKNQYPNCKFCAGKHNSGDCPNKLGKETHTPTCYHCNGAHTGDSFNCPKYQDQKDLIQRDPFPNLFNRSSIISSPPPSRGDNNLPSLIPTLNRFSVLEHDDDPVDNYSEPNSDEMEWDTEGEPPSSLPQSRVNKKSPGNKPNKQTYSSAILSTPRPRNIGVSKPPNKSNANKQLTRSSTEISLRGQENNPEISPASLIKYVMDRQEDQIKSILEVQSNTIQDIVDKQQKALQESIVHITNAVPSIVTKVLECILPSIITQVKSTLSQENSDHSSDNL